MGRAALGQISTPSTPGPQTLRSAFIWAQRGYLVGWWAYAAGVWPRQTALRLDVYAVRGGQGHKKSRCTVYPSPCLTFALQLILGLVSLGHRIWIRSCSRPAKIRGLHIMP